jgi:hypothetical protein
VSRVPAAVLFLLTMTSFRPGAAPAEPAADSTLAPPAADSTAVRPAPDSTAAPTSPDSVPAQPTRKEFHGRGEERDRWELGVAWPTGYFDLLGTLAYRRYLRESEAFEQSLKVEATGGQTGYLTEASLSLYYFFRPIRSYRMDWKLRPLVEVGPGLHAVFEAAEIEGMDEYSYHTKGFAKLHAYLGVEWLPTRKFGLLVCGRVTVPDEDPLDYAQAAILLR